MKEGALVMMKLLSLGLSAAEWWKLMSLGPDSTCETSYLAIVSKLQGVASTQGLTPLQLQ